MGLELADRLATEFGVSLVIDTGDMNNYGSPLEAAVLRSQIPTGVPRLYIPGNHDSPAVVSAMATVPNTIVLQNKRVTVDGVSVYGVADPAAERADVRPDGEEMKVATQQAWQVLSTELAAGEPTPTIVAVHDPEMAQPFEELAPYILAGHTHTPELERRGDAWYLNSGTTGGVDFSDLRSEPHIPHTASILYFTAEQPRRLIAVDQVEVFGLAGESSLRRTVIDESLLP